MSDFKELLSAKTSAADNIVYKYMPKEEGLQRIVLEAMNYSVKAGGKRVRPILMQETFKAFGGQSDIVQPFMAALEMIHTYSLVHDDLPCMDNDEYRRGMLTTWKKYGEDMAVLCGDSLLGYAFETVLKNYKSEYPAELYMKAMSVLADKAGCYGMLGGQVVDVYMTGKTLDEEQIEFIYKYKTAALIECAMMIGGILAGASEAEVKQIEKIAYSVGMAFQIKDDILDITSDIETLGKPINSDEKNNKVTYVTLHGLEASEAEVSRLMAKASEGLDSFPGDTAFLKDYFNALVYRIK